MSNSMKNTEVKINIMRKKRKKRNLKKDFHDG
jgi:hypothetical protein